MKPKICQWCKKEFFDKVEFLYHESLHMYEKEIAKSLDKKRDKKKEVTWMYKKKQCLICEKPLNYIPVGQRWKICNKQPVFYHESCRGGYS